MIKAVVLEDDPLDRDYLIKSLAEFCPEVNVICELDSGRKAVRLLPNLMFDLLLADINLGDMCTFQVLENLYSPSFSVIFVTSYDSYAVEAIKARALDYVLKPFEGVELRDAIDKALTLHKPLLLPGSNGNHELNSRDYMVVSEKTTDHIILLKSICYLKSNGNYTQIVYLTFGNEVSSVMGSYNLGYYAKLLVAPHFIRIHQSLIVNGHMLASINRTQKTVLLRNGDTLCCSRSGLKNLQSVMVKSKSL
jgi:two-component system LytT family response regulator